MCRRGFIRCRIREGPWGSHHEEARAEKCDISVSETVEFGLGGGDGVGVGVELPLGASVDVVVE